MILSFDDGCKFWRVSRWRHRNLHRERIFLNGIYPTGFVHSFPQSIKVTLGKYEIVFQGRKNRYREKCKYRVGYRKRGIRNVFVWLQGCKRVYPKKFINYIIN